MARPKNFDPESALRDALRVFWTRGYRNTSLSDLESALGIGRKSLYDTFGDKRALFLRALDAYARPPVESPDAGWAEIVETFRSGPAYRPEVRACFLVNTAIEFGVEDDEEILARLAAHNTRLREGFERSLSRAIAAGDVPDQDVRTAALYLSNALQGLSVMSRGGASEDDLHAIAETTLRGLTLPGAPAPG